MTLLRCSLAVLACAGLPMLASADELQATVTAGAGHTDNLSLVATHRTASDIAELGLRLGWQQLTARSTADVRADLEELDYLRKGYGSELSGALNARLAATLVPEALKWVLDDSLGTTRRDLLQAAGPANRENVNYVATGPDAMLTFGAADRLRLGARYARFDYQSSPRDNERYSGELSLAHILDSGPELSLTGRDEHVRYSQQQLGPADYDLQRLYAALGAGDLRSRWRLAAGASRAAGGNGADETGLLLQAHYERRVGTQSALVVEAGRQITDAGGAFADQRLLGTSLSSATLAIGTAATPFSSTYLRGGWDLAGRVTRLGFAGSWFEETYRTAPDSDRQRWEAELHASRRLGGKLTASALLTWNTDRFRYISGDAHDLSGRLVIDWNIGARIAIEASAERFRRSTLVAAAGIIEDRIWLRLRFGAAMVHGVGSFGALQ